MNKVKEMTLWLHFRIDKTNEVIYHVNKQIHLCGERRTVAGFLGQNAMLILRLRWMQYFNTKMFEVFTLQCKPINS